MIYLSSSSPCCHLFTPLNFAFDLGNETLRPNENMPYDLMKAWLQIDHETITEDNLKNDQQVYSMREKFRFSEERKTISGSVCHDLMEWCKIFNTGPLKWKCKEKILILDGCMQILRLTLAPLGMVALWRCQEHRRTSSLILN